LAFRIPPPDGSRDRRTDDPTNVWFVHLIGRILLPAALRLRIPANAVSLAGLGFGILAALAFARWRDPGLATAGFLLCLCWMIADGLDGMIARATGTASGIGRALDGLCDHGVFLFLYLALAWSLGRPQDWALGLAAGGAHAVQATLYEAERVRFHRRLRGDPGAEPKAPATSLLVRIYDRAASSLDRLAEPFDRAMARSPDPVAFAAAWRDRATAPLQLMIPLTNNMRVLLLYLTCLAADPRLFWWIELGPLSLIVLVGLAWLRRTEARSLGALAPA
jgi:CDP-diacylglycerol--serine O-phosphatidyltransferase